MKPEQIAARVWPGRELVVEPLGGGITNRNFKVETDGRRFVLRIGGRDTELLGIDRSAEHAASRIAGDLGLGPEVVAFVEPEGYLVTRFVVGEIARFTVDEVAHALRTLHGARAIPGRFDSFRVVEVYAAIAQQHGHALPPAYAGAQICLRFAP